MLIRRLLALILVTTACVGCARADQDVIIPSMDGSGLASGPHARMHGKVERTIFGIDIMNVELRFGEQTAERLRALVSGREFSEALADSIVGVVLETKNALVTIVVDYDIDVPRFLEESQLNLLASAAAGLIPQGVADEVGSNMSPWFEFLNSRGLKEGDRLVYGILGESVRSQFFTNGGQMLLDQTDPAGGERRLATLAGYLVPDTDVRDELVRSLFEN